MAYPPSPSGIVCAWSMHLVAFSRRSWRCLPQLPANATARLVALKRPITFLFACMTALFAVVASGIFTWAHLEPPSCPTEEPRTRPRPGPPVAPELAREDDIVTKAASTFDPLVHAVDPRIRPQPIAAHPPISKGRNARKFTYHELDGVAEDEHEEEEAKPRRSGTFFGRRGRNSSPSSTRSSMDPGSLPALTPDGGSEAGSDSCDELDHLTKATVSSKASSKPKGLSIWTSGFRWRRAPAHGQVDAIVSSPESLSPPLGRYDIAETSGAFSSLPISRQRASTIAHSHAPAFLSAFTRPHQRRHVSDPSRDRNSTSSLSPPPSAAAISEALSAVQAATDSQPATTKRKRAQTSLFFRSRSPLSQSPGPSPPLSPRLDGVRTAGCATGRRPSPVRSSSLNSQSSRSSTEERPQARTEPARGRKPTLGGRLPVPSPPLSQQCVDLDGHSGLRLGDFLR